jgi:hypothetical protein
MADESALLDQLLEARYSGVLTVRHGDRVVTYRSLAEIDQAIQSLQISINGGRRVHYFTPAMRRD